MQSKRNAPTANQKRWREAVRELGSVISGNRPCVIHHPIGVTGKHNKVAIGHWWVIPLTDFEHRELHRGVPIWRDLAVHSRKQFEIERFDDVKWYLSANKVQPPNEVFEAIADYHL
tara:strand:- start:1085 stop:1432 length:348 start_codon:yes stop_codon:yes gene_type:complete